MHSTQQKILELSKTKNIFEMGIRPLGRLVGEEHPQNIKFHLHQLVKQGKLSPPSSISILKEIKQTVAFQPEFTHIPVVGRANCGEATCLAAEENLHTLTISTSAIKKKHNLFALLARGNSMNRASIDGKSIDEGDYIIVDSSDKVPVEGNYVVSIIEGCANVKKFSRTSDGLIALLSEADEPENYPPIFISERDTFIINGKVIQVIKQ